MHLDFMYNVFEYFILLSTMDVGRQHPKSQSGQVDCLWVDCQTLPIYTYKVGVVVH